MIQLGNVIKNKESVGKKLTNNTKLGNNAKMSSDSEMEHDAEIPGTSKDEVSKKNKTITTSGIKRYITITKRKRSPNSLIENNNPKNKVTKSENASQNRFAELSSDDDEPNDNKLAAPPKPRPPPIYLREVSTNALIRELKSCVGEKNFHLVDLKRGQLTETKIQATEEVHYCKIVKMLETKNKHYYTYQLKSAKGLKVVLKGIDHNVDPDDIKSDLQGQGFEIKSVSNIKNRHKIPQPMFKIELTPEASKAPKGKPHPIYDIRYVLYRKITVEEPHKNNSLAQCQNCQEFGHTKTYCKLTSVCVACGEQHVTKDCTKDKNNSKIKKCSNCNGNHTANYRGCPVYLHIYSTTNQPNRPRNNPPVNNRPQQHYLPPPPPIISQANNNLSYADITKMQHPQRNLQDNQENMVQILMMLVTNMQQLTTTIQEMQKTLSAQNALLMKIASS